MAGTGNHWHKTELKQQSSLYDKIDAPRKAIKSLI